MQLLRGPLRRLSLLALLGVMAACTHPAPMPAADAELAAEVREDLQLRTETLYADYFPARTASAGPGILLLGGSEGGLGSGARRDALALRDQGYNVLQVSFYRAPGQLENLERVPLETFDHALAWLRNRQEVKAGHIGIYGTSKGAEAALVVASRHPEIAAIVAAAPSSVSWTGINWAFDGRPAEPSWSLNGEAYPAVPYGAWDPELGIYSLYANGLAALDVDSPAILAVEQTSAPILLICGGADMLWPSCDMAEQIRARAGGRPDVTILTYPEAGHFVAGVPAEAPSEAEDSEYGGTTVTNHASQKDSWPKILGFLADALRD
jgi:uncharacterized protein